MNEGATLTTILLIAFVLFCLTGATFLPEAFELGWMEVEIANNEASEGWTVHSEGVSLARFHGRTDARRFRDAIGANLYTTVSRSSDASETLEVLDTDAWFRLEMPSPRMPVPVLRTVVDAAYVSSLVRGALLFANAAHPFVSEAPPPVVPTRKARKVRISIPVVVNDNEGWTLAPVSRVVPGKTIDLRTMADQLVA